jgi:opacity protein-like surface antigen
MSTNSNFKGGTRNGGRSYMFMEVNDYGIRYVQRETGAGSLGDWFQKGSMDIASRAAMFNARVYLDDLSGWDMGRFSPYIFGGAGRATHKVTDFRARDDETLNGAGSGIQIYDFSASHNNKGVFAFRVGLGTLFKLTDHVSVDASASIMDWGKARASRYNEGLIDNTLRIMQKPIDPDVRTTQGSIGIQFNF